MNDYDRWAEIIKEFGYEPVLKPDEIIVDTGYTIIMLGFFEGHLIGSKSIMKKEE